MNCNKPNCCHKRELPREKMAGDFNSVAQTFIQLLEVARSGVDTFAWTSNEMAQLAQMIVALVRPSPPPAPKPAPDVAVFDGALTFRFGPQHSYALHVPTGDLSRRKELADQLRAAANQLSAMPTAVIPNQTMLPFSE
jgi:hypothetical protein